MLNLSKKKAVIILLLVAVSILLYKYSNSIPKEAIIKYLDSLGPVSIVVFILLNLVTYVVAPLSNTPLLIAGFYIYGSKVVLYIALAMILSFLTNFLIARIFGKKFVKGLVGKNNFKRVEYILERYDSPGKFLFLRLLQGAWHKFVSYAFGLTKMNLIQYLLLSLLGFAPACMLWYFASTKVSDPISFTLITQVIGIVPPLILTGLLFLFAKITK
jgi:uncharacterized membrane protein YdjX (TVP38/TMEM64 family)